MAVTIKNFDATKLKLPSKEKLKKIVEKILKNEKKSGWLVEITFISDQKMKSLNKRYRKIDKTTDVLSFSMGEDRVLGDVLISPKQALKNAAEYGATLKQEIFRLLIHGVLHLLGYEHGDKMFGLQEKFLCHAN